MHGEILVDRVMHTVIGLRGVLQRGDNPTDTATYLRQRLAEHPTTGYRHWGTQSGGEGR